MYPIVITAVASAAITLNLLLYFYYKKQLTYYRKESQRQRQLARHDSLTGLLNRKSIEEQISRILSSAAIPSPEFPCTCIYHALLILDLDHFKQINDAYGHPAGDCLLREISCILESSVRTTDLVGRLGGDEFLVFLNRPACAEAVFKKAEAIRREIRRLTKSNPGWESITASIGIALVPQDGITFTQLYEKADQSLYQVKRNGKNGYSC